MKALPPSIGRRPGLTGLSCPLCPGSLETRKLGRGYLEFRCRIGHVFALEEVLAAKEDRVEQALCAGEVGFAELSALLRDASKLASAPTSPAAIEARRRVLARLARKLAEIQDANEPLVLSHASPRRGHRRGR